MVAINSSRTPEDKLDDIDILEDLKNRIYSAIVNDEQPPRVGELLKVIEMKRKLSVEGKAEKKFWDMVNQIRREELAKSGSKTKRKNKKTE
jgi:hypothetical protein